MHANVSRPQFPERPCVHTPGTVCAGPDLLSRPDRSRTQGCGSRNATRAGSDDGNLMARLCLQDRIMGEEKIPAKSPRIVRIPRLSTTISTRALTSPVARHVGCSRQWRLPAQLRCRDRAGPRQVPSVAMTAKVVRRECRRRPEFMDAIFDAAKDQMWDPIGAVFQTCRMDRTTPATRHRCLRGLRARRSTGIQLRRSGRTIVKPQPSKPLAQREDSPENPPCVKPTECLFFLYRFRRCGRCAYPQSPETLQFGVLIK